MNKSEDVTYMVEVLQDYDTNDPDAEIHEYHAFPEGEQLEIHEDKQFGLFTYWEFNSDRKVIDSHEFNRYEEASLILEKRKNKIMGWKESTGTITLNYNPFKDNPWT